MCEHDDYDIEDHAWEQEAESLLFRILNLLIMGREIPDKLTEEIDVFLHGPTTQQKEKPGPVLLIEDGKVYVQQADGKRFKLHAFTDPD